MANALAFLVNIATDSVRWIRAQYRKFKISVANQIAKLLELGVIGLLPILWLVTSSILVDFAWNMVKQTAIGQAVTGFLGTIKTTALHIAGLFQVDLLLAALNLGVLLNKKLYDQLAPLYDELGNFAEELQLDFSYISTFIEVDRSILQASYALTGAGFLQGAAEFTNGLSTWLERLRGRLMDYAEDPRRIFMDIQEEIAGERIRTANDELAKIWSAIDFAGDWVRGKGEILIDLVGDIGQQVERMPDRFQDAIHPWFDPLAERVEAFERDRWNPFWRQYTDFTEAVGEMFTWYGEDIEELERRIDDPIDWIRSLLAMDEDEQATLGSTIDEFFARVVVAVREGPATIASAVVDMFAEVDRSLDDLRAAIVSLRRVIGGAILPAPPPIVVGVPWYAVRES